MNNTRRATFKSMLAGAALLPAGLRAAASRPACPPAQEPAWGSGVEGQRRADRGDGSFLNPIVAGDHPDPTILKDGRDYYMSFSSFRSYPGAVIWRSRDLVNWHPLGPALRRDIGEVWAMDLARHRDRYYLYIPAQNDAGSSIHVIWADDIRGPWSEPIDLHLPGCIDPGHAVGEDGHRYLFVNGIRRVRLSDDGLATAGPLEHAYSPWEYPKDWVVEMFAPEGPKVFRRGDWFYLVAAVGGTAGPPTSHMVIAARSRSIHGPWEHCPHNPLVRTRSADERWWSRGHASLVQGPAGDWWMVYHGYENGFRTLGRQALLEPVEWSADGWFRAKGGDLSRPLPLPARRAGGEAPAGLALSDDFTQDRFGLQWSFHNPGPDEMARVRREHGALAVAGKGGSPSDCSPLTCVAGDHAYEVSVTIDVEGGGEGGLLLFYSERMFVGVGCTATQRRTYNYGQEQTWMRADQAASRVMLRLRNDRHIVTLHYSTDGSHWTQHPWQMEVSGMHHNVFGGFLSLRPALFSSGAGSVRFSDYRYRALNS